MGRSLEIVVFFLHFFLGVVFSELGANQSECSESRCGHHGPAIRFPFRLKGLQPDYCGHPGFDLYCNEKNQTVLELPSSVKLLVKNIDYKYQELRLYDQHYCLERQLPYLDLSLSPFQITTPEYDSWNYTLFNCSSSIDESQANRVPCLEVNGSHIYAVESDSSLSSIPLLSCTKIYNLNNIPNIIYSLYLNWTTPRCGNCEAKGMTCRLKKNNSKETEIECFGRPAKGNKRLWIIIAISISLILLLLGFLCYKRKRKLRLEGEERERQEALIHELTTLERFKNANEVETNGREGRDLKIFSFACIMVATNNFSSENKLGQGGFGPVYKGKLPEGQKIAVKRLSRTSGQGLVEFKNELILIAKLQHMNLVRILGCCIHGEEKILIYEYMSNKSLDYYLFDPTKRELLDWKKRSNIIEGVAQGLLYLHKYSRLRIIHRDLKASNILLDENMNPKISDFGLARIFGQNETEAKTNRPIGTYGYMSPEYAIEGTFSIKSDVFSFGVIILEIMTGKKNYSSYHLDRPLNLIGYAWELWKEGAALELMDPTMGDSCPTHQLLRIIHLGLLCVQDRATDRPTMSDVISMLSNETMPLSDPKQPAFFTGCSVMEVNSHKGKSKDCSVNGLSISTMNAR